MAAALAQGLISVKSLISVKNFERFQHYKDRCPKWIKLYNELLDDYAFGCLPDASKMHLIAIWLLASRSNNLVPNDPKWIAGRINASEPVDLQPLFEAGFIVASEPLADCSVIDILEGEGEGEREGESVSSPTGDAFSAFQEFAAKHGLAVPRKLSDARRKKLAARIDDAGGLDGFRQALDRIPLAPGLLGKNARGWKASITWLLQQESFLKLIEGGYDGWGSDRAPDDLDRGLI